MSLYETVKELFLPDISKWESHLITIAVTVILVTILTYIILQKQNALQIQVYQATEKSLSISKHLALIVETSDDAIFSTDMEGKIISWNHGAENIFGISAQNIINQPLESLLPPEIPNRIPYLISQISLGRTIHHTEGVFIKKDASRIHLSFVASPIPKSYEKTGGISIIARDISEQIAREEMLKMINLKQHLLSSITRHDLNNSLQVLAGYCSILEDAISDPELHNIVSIIQNQSKVMNNQILFMKDYEYLGIKTPIWQSADKVFSTATIPFQNKQIIFQIPLENLEIYADPLIEKAIYNLCDNSIRYGEKLTYIRTIFAPEGDGCRWIIEDDGIGVQEDIKEKIFQKGFGHTNGLGLFFIREILSITNIKIRETGIPARGARFELIIPAGFWRYNHCDNVVR
jgi:PAS domain S-box-containing protein